MSTNSEIIAQYVNQVRANRETDRKNNVARPFRGTAAAVWVICDELQKQLGRIPYRQEVAIEADKHGFPRPTVFTNYGYWRVYNGFSGYISKAPGEPLTTSPTPHKAKFNASKEPSKGVAEFLAKVEKAKAKKEATKPKAKAKAVVTKKVKAKAKPKKKAAPKVVKAPEPAEAGEVPPPPLG